MSSSLSRRSKKTFEITFTVIGCIGLAFGVVHLAVASDMFPVLVVGLFLVPWIPEFWGPISMIAAIFAIGVSMVTGGIGMIKARPWGKGLIMIVGTIVGLLACALLFLVHPQNDKALFYLLIVSYLVYFALAAFVNLVYPSC